MITPALKRAFDVVVSASALALLTPLFGIVTLLIWIQDFHSPFYVAPRAARGGGTFRMIKFRSMRVGADRTGVDSTSAQDSRITPIGRFVRRYKLDELPQLWNVLRGDMSLVGPRPQVMREVAIYTAEERRLLDVRPGITDLSSIVFSDEGDVLAGHADPDLAYNQLIRPWKSRLGLLYARHASVRLDLALIVLTAVALVSRPRALAGVARILAQFDADEPTRRFSRRDIPLAPWPPPGTGDVVTNR